MLLRLRDGPEHSGCRIGAIGSRGGKTRCDANFGFSYFLWRSAAVAARQAIIRLRIRAPVSQVRIKQTNRAPASLEAAIHPAPTVPPPAMGLPVDRVADRAAVPAVWAQARGQAAVLEVVKLARQR